MKWITFGITGILMVSLIGCGVSKDRYSQLEREKQQLEERMARLMREKEQLATAVEDLETENQRLLMEQRRVQMQEREEAARMDALKQSQPVVQTAPEALDAEYK